MHVFIERRKEEEKDKRKEKMTLFSSSSFNTLLNSVHFLLRGTTTSPEFPIGVKPFFPSELIHRHPTLMLRPLALASRT